jgi:hypothetical protein
MCEALNSNFNIAKKNTLKEKNSVAIRMDMKKKVGRAKEMCKSYM